MPPEKVRVHTANGEIDAQQVRAFLEAHGISCEFHGEALRNTHGLTLDGLGRVELLVPIDQVDEARELLARADAGELALDESRPPDAPDSPDSPDSNDKQDGP